jgi:aspartate kinase
MAVVVQKFGGTSVATEQAREALLKQVKSAKDQGDTVILVVSAMGRFGEPYATDTLIGLLESINSKIDPRKKDLIMSCGEIISCSIIAHLLESHGIAAEPLTGGQAGILTTHVFGNSEIININTAAINKIMASGKVVVVAGFQGTTESGEITTLGRGGSDTAAVVIGGYMNADRVDIFTDVTGIAKVDPRIVSETAYIQKISYDDMYQLAKHGAKVIHPRAVEAAKEFSIPVRVRSTFSDKEGTLITHMQSDKTSVMIGMAIHRDEAQDVARIYILFAADLPVRRFEEFELFCEREGIEHEGIIWDENHITVLLQTNRLTNTTRTLYKYFHHRQAEND